MKHFSDNNHKWTYGAELEVGDVDRRVPIPADLGRWSLTESDVVNTREPYRGIACDPKGINPPFGGEVNMVPAFSCSSAAMRMDKILRHLYDYNPHPSFTSLNASHVHVRIPGLRDDVEALKKICQYVMDNQEYFLANTYMMGYEPPKWTKESRKAHMIPLDGNRKMTKWMNANIQKHATDIDSFLKLIGSGKDPSKRYRPFRYAVNMYALKWTDTIEFRWFRPSLSKIEWNDMFRFCRYFLISALDEQSPVEDYLNLFPRLPKVVPHELELLQGWEKTAYSTTRSPDAPLKMMEEAQ